MQTLLKSTELRNKLESDLFLIAYDFGSWQWKNLKWKTGKTILISIVNVIECVFLLIQICFDGLTVEG